METDTYLQDLRDTFMNSILPYMRASGKSLTDAISDFVSPLAQKFGITQKFGAINDIYKGVTQGARHLGLDIGTPVGTQVMAPVSGRIVRGYDPTGYGQFVKVVAPTGEEYQFSHLRDYAPELGNEIKAGQALGYTGGVGPKKGRSTGAHLDISVRKGGKLVDPLSIEALQRALM